MYTVESNFPIPCSPYSEAVRTFQRMNHGDSFVVPYRQSKSITSLIRTSQRRTRLFKVVTRRYTEGVRIWKVSIER